jgi:hypothetical protein
MNMTTETAGLPPIFKGATRGNTISFDYAFKDGSEGRVVGVITRYSVSADLIEIRLISGFTTSKLRHVVEANRRDPRQKFTISHITALATGITSKPIDEAAEASAPRPDRPTDAQVRYAVSLSEATGVAGAGNFVRHTEAEFRAMSRRDVSAWIDMAKSEMDL